MWGRGNQFILRPIAIFFSISILAIYTEQGIFSALVAVPVYILVAVIAFIFVEYLLLIMSYFNERVYSSVLSIFMYFVFYAIYFYYLDFHRFTHYNGSLMQDGINYVIEGDLTRHAYLFLGVEAIILAIGSGYIFKE